MLSRCGRPRSIPRSCFMVLILFTPRQESMRRGWLPALPVALLGSLLNILFLDHQHLSRQSCGHESRWRLLWISEPLHGLKAHGLSNHPFLSSSPPAPLSSGTLFHHDRQKIRHFTDIISDPQKSSWRGVENGLVNRDAGSKDPRPRAALDRSLVHLPLTDKVSP